MSNLAKYFRAFQSSVTSKFSFFMEQAQGVSYTESALEGPYEGIILSDPEEVEATYTSQNGEYVPIFVRISKTDARKIPDPFEKIKSMNGATLEEKAKMFLKIVELHPVAYPSLELQSSVKDPFFKRGSVVECMFVERGPTQGGKERGLVYTRILRETSLFDDMNATITAKLADSFNFSNQKILSDFADESQIESDIYLGAQPDYKNKSVQNGRLPSALLGTANTGFRVLFDLVNKVNQLEEAWNRKFPNNPFRMSSGYRDFEGQVYQKEKWTSNGKPQNAATPGTSNHGFGIAVDIGNLYQLQKQDFDAVWTSEEYNWMRRNALKYGFKHPPVHQKEGSVPEAWHWEAAQSYFKNN